MNDSHLSSPRPGMVSGKGKGQSCTSQKTRHCGVFCKNYDVENHKRNGRSEERSRGVGGMYTKRTLSKDNSPYIPQVSGLKDIELFICTP